MRAALAGGAGRAALVATEQVAGFEAAILGLLSDDVTARAKSAYPALSKNSRVRVMWGGGLPGDAVARRKSRHVE